MEKGKGGVCACGVCREFIRMCVSQALIQSSADRLAKLAAKWEEVRKPLLERYRAAKAESENRESETSKLLEEIRYMRERMKAVADETRVKDDLYKQLVGEYERMSKDLSRVSYTRRIMEIVLNIQRQKEDIGKILGDTRQVQKEINQLSGRLERIFTVTDEQVYKDARKDEARRTAYKLLASLREVGGLGPYGGPRRLGGDPRGLGGGSAWVGWVGSICRGGIQY